MCIIFFFKQKTAYEMRISDWSSDVCSSDLSFSFAPRPAAPAPVAEESIEPEVQEVPFAATETEAAPVDRKSVVEGKSVSVRVDLGGRRIIQKKKKVTQ